MSERSGTSLQDNRIFSPMADESGALQPPNKRRFDIVAMWQVTSMSLGIGLFSIPYCFVKLGMAASFFWVALLGTCAASAMIFLLDLAVLKKVDSYELLAEIAFGKTGKVFMAGLTAVTTFIATLSYMSAACTLLSNMIVQFFLGLDVNSHSQSAPVIILDDRKHAMLLTVLALIVFPRCLSKSMGDHEWISTASVITITCTGVCFIALCVDELARGCPNCGNRAPEISDSVSDTLQYIATLAFSFSMVFAVFPVMKDRLAQDGVQMEEAVSSMKPVVIGSVTLSCIIYCLVGVMGAVTFGDMTKSVGINNLALSNPIAQVISLIVGINCMLLVPVISFPTLQSVELLMATSRSYEQDLPAYTRPVLVVLLAVLVILVDVFLPTKIAFALTGSLGCSLSAYIIPCLLFLKLVARSSCKLLAMFVLIVGCVLLFASTPVTMISLIGGDSDIGKDARPVSLAEAFCSTSWARASNFVAELSV
mmetsp:Transcript_22431/g.35601  ORF Transcript_22431/g.35601 Transcript_22431/m.35601 type:complete len:480 (+) Transcript_22431:39-1478(+)